MTPGRTSRTPNKRLHLPFLGAEGARRLTPRMIPIREARPVVTASDRADRKPYARTWATRPADTECSTLLTGVFFLSLDGS